VETEGDIMRVNKYYMSQVQ